MLVHTVLTQGFNCAGFPRSFAFSKTPYFKYLIADIGSEIEFRFWAFYN